MKWIDQAWKASEHIYDATIKMPYIQELIAGTLPLEKFQYYLKQDSLYLQAYARALSFIAAKMNEEQFVLPFIKFAEGTIVIEAQMHGDYFEKFGIKDLGPIMPDAHHYVSFLKATAAADTVEEAIAAVLPCFWIYKEVGDYIYAQPRVENNPYQAWIDTYGSEEFAQLVKEILEIVTVLTERLTETQRQKMIDKYVMGARLEYMFWDGAYHLRNWDTEK